MLCLKAEEMWGEMYASHGAVLPVNLGGPIQKAMQRRVRENGERRMEYGLPDLTSSSFFGDRCSHFEEAKSIHGHGADLGGKISCYRSRLEKEVQILEKQLENEINLHAALANGVGNTVLSLSWSSELPHEARELLGGIYTMEIAVRKLEEELLALHLNLQHERIERRAAEIHVERLQMESPGRPSTSGYIWEEHLSSLRMPKLVAPLPPSRHLDVFPESQDIESMRGGPAVNAKVLKVKNISPCPNKLSEEMVLCMSKIFLRLSKPLKNTAKASLSEWLSSSYPAGNLSHSSSSFSSDSSGLSSSKQTSPDLLNSCEAFDREGVYDPYGVSEKVNSRDIGVYCLATEVSWMSVGKEQLDYAAESLKKFRFLVEQLANVNPAHMSGDEKLAFWINLYNALIMHTYLAYGVPRNDIKLFSLMRKACYLVGGQSFSAADIEFVILKMKPPAHRPQIALTVALHKFKMTEEHRKYSIDCSEPLALFGLSCGMYSCPAVRIFRAGNVQEELKKAMKEYIQASVGINEKGKLLVPKLLHFFANGVVEDSMLVDWICRYLTPDQASAVRNSTSPRKQRLLSARSFSVIPFDSRFRYLFLLHGKAALLIQ